MSNLKSYTRDPLYVVEPLVINPTKKITGKLLVWGSFSLMLLLAIVQYLKISGNIRSKSKIEVEGFVKGSITSPEVVSGLGSRIVGPIRSDNLFVAGHVVGKIYAKQARFGNTSRVEGDVSYDKVVVDEGTTFDGKVSFKRLKKT